ncbi:MAG: glycosyltransferase family 4 protein [Chloroflexi bacterium]|nr:glycosyltransferase family 4 protein [Chloroflexota bacterium]
MEEDKGKRPLRICYFGTYRAKYTRNQILINGLRMQDGVEVYECHAQLWHSIEDRVEQASGGWRNPRFWLRVLKTYWRLFRAHNKTPEYDAMLIGYPGQFDAYLARLLTWRRRKPMALDILMSLHLVAEERGLTEKNPFTARLIFWLEKGGLKLPDLLISENGAYEAYYCQKYNLPPDKFQRVPHGADERVYHPRPIQPPENCFRITYHGMYLPSHGLDAILEAAQLLRNEIAIQFHFYGDGPERVRIEQSARQEELTNVVFHGFVSRDELLDGLAQAHICLGVFGETKQSHYTIQNKVWEGLAMGRAVVSGDSAVVRETLSHGEHIYLAERDNGRALADAILHLKANPDLRERMSAAGYSYFSQLNAIPILGAATVRALKTML